MRAGLTLAGGLLMALAVAPVAAPVHAQASSRTLTIFGNDKCPTSNGEEIVVCNRLPEGDRFRIPETLRTTSDTAPDAATRRVEAMNAASSRPVGTCSVGDGSQIGCQKQLNQAWKAGQRAAAAEDAVPRN